MVGMTTQQRLDDICEISGLSEEIVRRVQDAECKSIIKTLRKGERSTLIGRCVIRPEIRTKIQIGGEPITFIKLSVSPAASLEAKLSDLPGFEIDDDDSDMEGIWVSQIPALI